MTAENNEKPIAIIGASAAGLFTGLLLANSGRKIRIFERSERLNPALRTLIVTNRFRNLLGDSSAKCVVNEIRRLELFTDGRAATVPLESPDLVIERSCLIRELAARAEFTGTSIEFGHRFVEMTRFHDGISLDFAAPGHTNNHGIHHRVLCDAVVGADGAHSAVASAAGWPKLKTVPLLQAIVQLPSGMPADSVRVWFAPDDTPYFYWLIPESRTRGALGLIGVNGQSARRCLQQFLERRHFRPLSFQGARIPIYEGWVPVERRIGPARIYLVGDAAAQVKVTTVGGIVTGFRGALGVAERIITGRASPELRALRRELDLHMLIRRSIHRFRQADYSRLVDSINERVLRSLGKFSRDEAGRVLWRVCRNQPKLALMGLCGLLASSGDELANHASPLGLSLWRPSVIQK